MVSESQLSFGFGAVKRCSMCGEVKPLTDFHRNRRMRDGRQSRCKRCNVLTNKAWYRENPDVRDRRMDAYAKRRRKEAHELVWRYLESHPCVDCGESDPLVLEFDHLRDKIANVSAMVLKNRPWEVIEAEIEKCQVVCANCHRRRTAARARTYRYLRSVGDAGVEPWGRRGSNPGLEG